MKDLWEVQVRGECCSDTFEISVIRKNDPFGRDSYGWFSSNGKKMISHGGWNGALTEKIWDKMIILAGEVAAELNAEEFGGIDET